jgi:hypothetical protein
MLRHIVSVGLAITACAAFMPTKASAATLTATPIGEIPKNPGDLIDFTFVLNPRPSTLVQITKINLEFNLAELTQIGQRLPVLNSKTSDPTLLTIIGMFRVRTPVKDGRSDAWARVDYDEFDASSGNPTTSGAYTTAFGGDVVPVPEPVTMFGTAIGLGCGVLFKRKSSKKTVS